ncbi:SUA5/yciO/yrdC domain protein [Gloeothece citriformis PCC 7424]|uniref:L-threonylcarbamoyladenylate synthase n=1 Tax=Gloeothece citriformis (strain PCC 7424) TaxID=65393 RepID=B7KK91_GLOC7|nr:L-threonylcarbamoyladenylate synthase [Gloeothece citriformis]ACK70976.1 SUA5/yciO/yrdC domain protein [Gloeothece citriformis PCC 7424]
MPLPTAQRSINLVREIEDFLEAGEVIILPTDISYILVAHAFKPRAIAKIAQLKGWNSPQPLILLTNRKKVEEFGVVSPASGKLIDHFPYPITLIIPKKKSIPDSITAQHSSLFIACPDQFIYDLVDQISFPMVCTTAGFSADYKARRYRTAIQLFEGQVPLIVDGGDCKYDSKGTLIDCTLETPTILNFGTVSVDDLREILPEIELPSHLRK